MKNIITTLFYLITFTTVAQNLPNDCQNYIQACDNQSVSYNVSGAGTQEIVPPSCSSEEHNSLWMRVTIDQGGTLGFTITPQSSSITEDYDFWVFGPNSDCSSLGSPIRCSTTNPQDAGQNNNHTGLNSTSNDVQEGPGQDGDSFLKELTVTSGQSYFIVIDRPIGNSAFSLQWTGTATIANPFQGVSFNGFPVVSLCDAGNDNLEDYNFDDLTSDFLDGISGFSVSYFQNIQNATFNSNPIVGTTAISSGIYYARIESDTSDCFEVEPITVVFQGITTQDYSVTVCEEDEENYALVSLTDFESEVYTGNQNVSYSYYNSLNEAQNMQNPLGTVQNLQLTPGTYSYFVRVGVDATCFDIAEITIEVIQKPVINVDAELKQCDDDTDGFTAFNLEEANSIVVDDVSGLTFEYYLSLAEAESGINAISDTTYFENQTVGTQVVYYSVTNANGCRVVGELTLLVGTTQIPSTFQTLEYYSCDATYADEEDGIAQFDFSDASAVFTALFPTQNVQVSYYETLEDALAEVNSIVDTTTFVNTIEDSQAIYVRIDSEINNECVGLGDYIHLNVMPRPIENEAGEYFICLDEINNTVQLTAGIRDGFSISNYSYQWFMGTAAIAGASDYYLTINEAGLYSVQVTDSNSCVYTREISVTGSEAAQIEDVFISDLDLQKEITILVSGSGDYEYSIDGENYQDSNLFTDVPYGIVTLYVRDKNGCGVVTKEIIVLGFPQFFTPNGDGINDFWNVVGVNDRYSRYSKISIFDRYGKLISQFRSTATGWDGTFNGEALPATDYWCVVELPDGRLYKGHFALIR